MRLATAATLACACITLKSRKSWAQAAEFRTRALLDGETFIVINGKIITDIDLNAALETHRRAQAIATLVVLPNPSCERFSIVKANDGLLQGFGGMPVK